MLGLAQAPACGVDRLFPSSAATMIEPSRASSPFAKPRENETAARQDHDDDAWLAREAEQHHAEREENPADAIQLLSGHEAAGRRSAMGPVLGKSASRSGAAAVVPCGSWIARAAFILGEIASCAPPVRLLQPRRQAGAAVMRGAGCVCAARRAENRLLSQGDRVDVAGPDRYHGASASIERAAAGARRACVCSAAEPQRFDLEWNPGAGMMRP